MNRIYLYSMGATIGGILVLGCWFFIDYRRRRDPNFKKKQKLKREYEAKLRELNESKQRISPVISPVGCNEEDIVIIRELQLGEDLLAKKHFEEALNHFANAITVSSDPENFLKILKANLEPELYYMLLNVLAKNNNSILMENNSKKQAAGVVSKDPFQAKSRVVIKS